MFACARAETEAREVLVVRRDVRPEAGVSDTGLHGGACEADWSGGWALTGQGRGSLRA